MMGYVVTVLGIIFPFVNAYFEMQFPSVESASTFLLIGVFFGAFFGGDYVERIGKRQVALFDMLLVVLFIIPVLIYFNQIVLDISLLLVGIGLGGEFSVPGALIRDYFPKQNMIKLHGLIIMFQAIGSLFGAITAVAVLLIYPHEADWKFFLISIVLFAFVVLTGRFFLLKKKYKPKFKETVDPEPHKNIFDFITKKKNFKLLILSAVPWFCMDFSVYGINLFTPTILKNFNLNFSFVDKMTDVFLKSEIPIIGGTAFIDLFLVLGFILGLFLLKKMRVLNLQIMGFLFMALSFAILIFGNLSKLMPLIIIGFLLFNLTMNMGPNLTTFNIPHLIFKPKKVATAQGISAGIGKLGAITSTLLFPYLLKSSGVNSVLLVVLVLSLIGAVVTFTSHKKVKR